ncbi:MAG: TetR/AcrR family transcriptional regulator [Micropepsaceae bacterium]
MAANGPGRENQKRRTRKALLESAARLARTGAQPTLEDVAADAMVSRATAYRYFPSIEALMVEAALDVAFPEADAIFAGTDPRDPVARLDRADDAIDAMVLANEPGLRIMLKNALEPRKDDGDTPARQNRRLPLIEAALAPARDTLRPAAVKPLAHALSLVFGLEARLVLKDVLGLDDAEARKARRFAIRAMIDAARK